MCGWTVRPSQGTIHSPYTTLIIIPQPNKTIKLMAFDNSKEYILCAAIWYKNWPGKIIHQPINIHKGLVLCGRRHHNIIEIASKLGNLPTKQGTTQGFLTSRNRFVDRVEAVNIAVVSGQSRLEYIPNELHSEDIY